MRALNATIRGFENSYIFINLRVLRRLKMLPMNTLHILSGSWDDGLYIK